MEEEQDDLRNIIEQAYDEQVEEVESEDVEESIPEGTDSPPASDVEAQEEEATEQEEESKEAPESEPILAPNSWKSEDREVWKELPRKAQETVLRRERERDTYLFEKAKDIERLKKEYDSIEDAIAPYEQHWDLQGVSAADAIRQAVAMRQQLLNNPKEFISWVAQQSGLDLSKVVQSVPQTDPQIANLQSQYQQLQAQLQQQQQLEKQKQHQILVSDVERFAAETANGKRVRPHFEAVWNQMVPLVQAYKASNPQAHHSQILQAAYDAAVLLNPASREAVEAERLRQLQQRGDLDAKQKALKAKRAGKSIVGGSGKAATPSQPNDIRSLIEAAWEAHA